jgi:hypothetical protein
MVKRMAAVLKFRLHKTRDTLNGSTSANEMAIAGMVLFVTLILLWLFTPLLTALADPSSRLPPQIWILSVVAPALLLGASAYLREPSILWLIPLKALAMSCIIVGLSVPILHWRIVTSSSVAICVAYIAAGAALGWLMRKLQKRFL